MRYRLCFVLLLAVAVGCGTPLKRHNLPPAQQLMQPGPGVGGPGPGVMACPAGQMGAPQQQTVQIAFVGPDGMNVAWDVTGTGVFGEPALVCPGRQNFPENGIYRLKVTNIPMRPGVELYPTLEVGPIVPRTAAFLSHNTIPVNFTDEDFEQVRSGNYVTKVLYLPDPEFQEMAMAGIDTLVSTALPPGEDPIVEADRRGAILGIIRMGNIMLNQDGFEGDIASVVAAGYQPGGPSDMLAPGMSGPAPMHGVAGGAPTAPSAYISGVTGPQYGMPISGTPIGLPGPPHVPLGGPAGLQKHVMRNWTRTHIPGPTQKVRIDMVQSPGYSYPKPANHALIVERTRQPLVPNVQPVRDRVEVVAPTQQPCP